MRFILYIAQHIWIALGQILNVVVSFLSIYKKENHKYFRPIVLGIILSICAVAIFYTGRYTAIVDKTQNEETTIYYGNLKNEISSIYEQFKNEIKVISVQLKNEENDSDEPEEHQSQDTESKDENTNGQGTEPKVESSNGQSGNSGDSVEINVGANNGGVVAGNINGSTINNDNSTTVIITDPIPEEPPVTVTQVNLNKNDITLKIGDTDNLTATVLYSDNSSDTTVKWSSSNPDVATITENGTIVAVNGGVTKITAQASKNNESKYSECIVTVIPPLSGYTISLSSYQTTMGSKFYVYVQPNESNYTKISVHAKSPSGVMYTYELKDDGYYIDTETGSWTIYATIINEYYTYEANKESDFVTLEVLPFDFDSLIQ